MKTRYKYIHFVDCLSGGHDGYSHYCKNNTTSAVLGVIQWYPKWKTVIFSPWGDGEIVFNASCLEDIAHFMKQLSDSLKKKAGE